MSDDKIEIESIKKNVNNLKKGTLRFWGEWFGRPMDNCHVIKDVQFNYEDNKLILIFEEGETLTIWTPIGIKSNLQEFYIRNASKIKWEWFSYGKSQTQQNLYFKEYENQGDYISISSGREGLEFTGKKIMKTVGQHSIEIC